MGSRKRPDEGRTKKAEEKQAEKDDKEAEDKGKALATKLDGRTLGQYLAGIEATIENPERRRGVGQTRKMVGDEFAALWQAQSLHHPNVLTVKLRRGIEDIALFQRPTYFRRRTIGRCDLEPGEERALKAEWLTQRFEMLQLVNALRLEGGNRPPLDAEQRQRAIAYLERAAKPTWARLRKEIGLPKGATFTHEHGKKESVRGNATEVALHAALGKAWDELPAATRDAIRGEIGQAWHRIEYKAAKDGAILEIRDASGIDKEREEFARRAEADWGLPADQAKALAEIDLPDETAQHSLKAMQKLLPRLEKGEAYMTALQGEYTLRESGHPVRALPGPNPSELRKVADPFVKREMEKLLAGIRNPTVLRTLGELQKVVNTLLRVHGRPDAIRLEMARDLKKSAEERRATDSEQRRRERAREDARKKLGELSKAATGADGEKGVLRLLLWEEQGGRCPYSGESISCAQALSAETTEIDHIFPVSRSFDDSQANKVLCFERENRAKLNRTPFEWLNAETDRWTHLGGVVWPQMQGAGWPESKRRRCEKPALEQAEEEAFTNRQLEDTAFIAKAARAYLGLLFGGGQAGLNAVQAVPGRATALLRRGWGVGLGKLLRGEAGEGPKARDDLRHHAVDALVVALTGPGTVHALSRYWQIRETTATRPLFPPPWPNFREQAKREVEAIVVSHRVQAKLSGALHDELPLGVIRDPHSGGRETFVIRKRLKSGPGGVSAGEVERIVDPAIREVVKRAIAAAGGKLDGALAAEIRVPTRAGGPGPVIRSVRVRGAKQDPCVYDRVHRDPRRKQFKTNQALHHVAIYAGCGGVEPVPSLKRDGMARARSGTAVTPPYVKGNLKLQFSLCRGDALARDRDGGAPEVMIVADFYRNGQIFLEAHHYGGKSLRSGSRKPGPLLKEGWRKVAVDPIGRVFKAR